MAGESEESREKRGQLMNELEADPGFRDLQEVYSRDVPRSVSYRVVK